MEINCVSQTSFLLRRHSHLLVSVAQDIDEQNALFFVGSK